MIRLFSRYFPAKTQPLRRKCGVQWLCHRQNIDIGGALLRRIDEIKGPLHGFVVWGIFSRYFPIDFTNARSKISLIVHVATIRPKAMGKRASNEIWDNTCPVREDKIAIPAPSAASL